MKIPDGIEAKELLDEPPIGLRVAYHPTCQFAWFIGRNEEDLVLGQKWVCEFQSEYECAQHGVPENWVRLRKYMMKAKSTP